MVEQTRLFIGNIPDNVKETELHQAFSDYGEVNTVDIKTKPEPDSSSKKFAFITLSASSQQIESCIKYFTNVNFKDSKLYVTRARESFLERLQRERAEQQSNEKKKEPKAAKKQPVLKLGEKLNPRKRKLSSHADPVTKDAAKPISEKVPKRTSEEDTKKQDAEKKRLESMRKKQQEFKEKQRIIKNGLIQIDKAPRKKVVFTDSEDENSVNKMPVGNKTIKNDGLQKKSDSLFDDDDNSEDDFNFEIKKQFEGKKGQKVLELQSRYKSDKRFMLDERFYEDDETEERPTDEVNTQNESIDVSQADEKVKQLNILENILGVSVKPAFGNEETKDKKKLKSKLGMLRFDPFQPEHSKFLAPVEEKQKTNKKKKKSSEKDQEMHTPPVEPEPEKVQVSKEQFYKVSDTLKEAIAQPNQFSLRSLFKTDDGDIEDKDKDEADTTDYIPLEKTKKAKVKNPLEPKEKNPFKYDSSDSETEDNDSPSTTLPVTTEVKAIWREKLFFDELDDRLKEGIQYFMKTSNNENKERRELKTIMKKRLYNKERKDQMFKKKIGGRRKTVKKSYKKKLKH